MPTGTKETPERSNALEDTMAPEPGPFLVGDLKFACEHNRPGGSESVAECECESASHVRYVHGINRIFAYTLRELHSKLARLKAKAYELWTAPLDGNRHEPDFARFRAELEKLWAQGHEGGDDLVPCSPGFASYEDGDVRHQLWRQLQKAEHLLEGHREVRRDAARMRREWEVRLEGQRRFALGLLTPDGPARASALSVLEAQELLLRRLDELACFRLGPDSYLPVTALWLHYHMMAAEKQSGWRGLGGSGNAAGEVDRFRRDLEELCTDVARERLSLAFDKFPLRHWTDDLLSD